MGREGRGHGLGCQPEVVGEKDINFPGWRSPGRRYAARAWGHSRVFGTGKQDGLIGYQPQGGIDRSRHSTTR